MTKFLVCSDLHGDPIALDLLLKRMVEERADHLICAGDIGINHLGAQRDRLRQLSIPFTLVGGNCDLGWAFSEAGFQIPPRYTTVKMGTRTLFITHGHFITSWREAPLNLFSHDIFISGHTHIASLKHPKGAPILLNPGSASSPRNHQPPSYALITETEISIRSLDTRKQLHTLVLK